MAALLNHYALKKEKHRICILFIILKKALARATFLLWRSSRE